MRRNGSQYRQLNAGMVAKTTGRLRDRIAERFPDSGLSQVARELLVMAEEAGRRTQALNRPYLGLRLLVFLVVGAGVAALVWAGRFVDWRDLTEVNRLTELTPFIESAVNLLIVTGGAAWFLLTLEERIRRSRTQAWLHQLRALAHVIDMHQLVKDPTAVLDTRNRTKSSPQRTMSRFELTRYLEYCAEMLALVGKLAALLAGETDDHVIVAASADIEDLCTNLGRKVWQKIMILGELEDRAG